MGRDESAQAGFSYWSTVPGGGGTYRNAWFIKNGVKRPTDGYKTDWVGNDAIEFIEQNRDKPFLLYCAFFAPHILYDYQPDVYRAPYTGSKFSCFPDEPMNPWHTRTMFGRTFGTLKDFHNPESKLSYSALVTGMDHNLGRIVNRLEELGIRENTVIAFSRGPGTLLRSPWHLGQRQQHRADQYVRRIVARAVDLEPSRADCGWPRPGPTDLVVRFLPDHSGLSRSEAAAGSPPARAQLCWFPAR